MKDGSFDTDNDRMDVEDDSIDMGDLVTMFDSRR
jgi:hypothetical protein